MPRLPAHHPNNTNRNNTSIRNSKRSRILWEEVINPLPTSTFSSRARSLLCAIGYELQLIRYSELKLIIKENNIITIENIKHNWIPFLSKVISFLVYKFPKIIYTTIIHLEKKQYILLGSIFIYYMIVRWIHNVLDAGPVVMIITALILIFTIGLGDNERNEGELSAYSVFNRGFQRLMGSVDVDSLLAQHVGGGGIMMMQQQQQQQDEDFLIPAAAPRQRNARPPAAAAAVVQQNEDNNTNNNNDDNNVNDDNEQQQQQQQQLGARKSGKKARRQRNVEDRHELRRQRDAAIAIGLDGTGSVEEMMAMQRLIEDQVAVGGARAAAGLVNDN